MLLFSHTTGIHFTDELVEWAVLRKSRNGTEKLRDGSRPLPEDFFKQQNAPPFPADVLTEIRRFFKGIVTVSLPSAQLIMRVLELPSTDPAELQSMVELQLDRISPFPLDQLTVSYEMLHQTDAASRVLGVGAPRKTVDALGDLFKQKNVYIRSLDAEILAWWSLLIAHSQVPCQGRVVLILEEHTEFSMIIVDQGFPVCFRSLELFHDFTDENVMREVAEEVRYTLLSLESEYGQRETTAVLFWSESDVPPLLVRLLQDVCGTEVGLHDLGTLPPLAEGLALRTAERRRHHVELVPREWIDLQRKKQILRIAAAASIAVLSVWLAVVTVTGIVFSIRQAGYNRVRREAALYEGPAREAQTSREILLSLETYAERSGSALECLREVTAALPSDVEITSFTYRKGDSVSLRGISPRPEPVYDFFQQLGASGIFSGVKDQPVDTRVIRDRRVSVFSITADLPKQAGEAGP